MLLSCLAASVSLTYFPLIVPSLRVLAQRLAATQTDSTLLMRARPCGGGAEGGARFHFTLCLKVLEGKHLAGPARTWPPAQPPLAATHTVHMCSVAARSSHFPPLFSYLQDVERLQTGEGGGVER